MKKHFRIISAILILVLCMTSISFASTSKIDSEKTNSMSATAASATLITMGTNWQLWDGIPSTYATQSWSSWQTYNDTLSAYSVVELTYDMANAIIVPFGGWWSLIGLSLLASSANQMGTATFFQGIINTAPTVNGAKTSYARVYESHASAASGYQQFSKVYIKYYTNSARTTLAGTSETIFLYSWATGSKIAQ